VAEVLAAYEDRENRPGPPVLGPDRDGLLVQLPYGSVGEKRA